MVLIPLGAVIFRSMGRHPLAGLAAAFAGVSGGFGANLFLTGLDPLMAGFTEPAARMIEALGRDVAGVHDLADDRQADLVAGLLELAQALDAEALETVRAALDALTVAEHGVDPFAEAVEEAGGLRRGGEEPLDLGAEGVIAAAALEMVAARSGVAMSETVRREILGGIRALPAHPEALDALKRLKDAGCRLATLTNSPPSMVESQLERSGLKDQFDAIFSVDAVRMFKPARAVYDMAARELGERLRGGPEVGRNG